MIDAANPIIGVDPPTRRRFVILGMLFISVVINYLDRSNLSIVAPRLASEMHLSPGMLGAVFSAFGWTYAAFQMPAGWLVDRVHPRFLYALILALWSLGTLAMGLGGAFITLLALRLVVGAFEAPAYTINNRIVTTWFREDERASAIGFYTSGQFVGLAFLTPVLSWVEAAFGWRAVFAGTGALGLVWAVLWFGFYRDPAEFHGVNRAELHRIAAGGGIPDLSLRLSSKRSSSWNDLRQVLVKKKLWGIYIGQFGLSCTLWFYLTWFPTYLEKYRHIDFLKTGVLASFPFLAAFVGVLSGGLLSDWLLRRGHSLTVARKTPILIGLMLATFIVFANFAVTPALIILCMCFSFFGCGLASITWSLVSALAPERLIGLTGGVFNFVSNCAAIVVPISIGLLIRGESFLGPLLFIAAMAIVGGLSYIFLVGKIERIVE